MKAFFFLRQKGKITFLLLAILFVELFSSFSQRSNCSRLGEAVHEVYSDRLIAQDYIYKINEKVHEQKYSLIGRESLDAVKDAFVKSNTGIEEMLKRYALTKLTPLEEEELAALKQTLGSLQSTLNQESGSPAHHLALYTGHIERTFDHLNKLSAIQLTRGRELNTDSEKITLFAGVIDEVNTVVLIVIGLVILGMILASKSVLPKFPQKESLN